jgi:SPX domain protein involved in polyphosphate accumulation
MQEQLNKVEDFARYEFKYLLNKFQRDLVEEEIANFMEYDGHVHKELNNSYFVRSLYFDNELSSNFYEKVDGMRTRSKFRIRTYGKEYEDGLPIYLEQKGRSVERTYKHRIKIQKEELELFYDARKSDELLKLYPSVDLISRFCYEVVRKNISPKALVDYRRKPYTSSFDMNFRVTFDDNLIAAAAQQPYLFDQLPSWRQFNSGYTIMEVKFFRRIPPWFHRILQAYNLRRLSISKFARGMEVCGFAKDTGG